MTRQSGFYAEYNARNLSPEEVAASFVPPEAFYNLCDNNHVVLLGPRGSGKTTLLKMLNVRALAAWVHERAQEVRERVRFNPVYVPTDHHWHHQLKHYYKRLEEFPTVTALLSETAVTANVLTALLEAMEDRLSTLEDSPQIESAICRSLVSEWRLPPSLPTFGALSHSIASRINDLEIVAHRIAASGAPDRYLNELSDFYYLDYLAAARVACDTFDSLVAPHQVQKWALCFDELELAPGWLQTRLSQELRSTDQRFLFKLSTSPIPNVSEVTTASQQHDFTLIRLWPHSKTELRHFSEQLVRSELRRRYNYNGEPTSIFGRSPFSSERAPDYAPQSPTWKLFREFSIRDRSFARILDQHGISPSDPWTPDQALRDSVLRKAKPIVMIRQAFTKGKGTDRIKRSRKAAPIYYGAEALYDITDGNPRLLIGILREMLPPAGVVVADLRPISKYRQSAVLNAASKSFAVLLASLPDASEDVRGQTLTLYSLLRSIGSFFFENIALHNFRLDPVGSFTVDRRVEAPILNLLRVGVYHGAIILINPTGNPFNGSLEGKRFRLSYMLAPTFKLPFRLYDPVPLSRCLKGRDPSSNQTAEQQLLMDYFHGT